LLPLLPRERVVARLRRQERNAGLLAAALRDRCDVSPVGYAGLLFCAHPRAAQLIACLELLALARRARVFRGTSFGFNDTRVALVPGVEGQLRFACGLEHEAAAIELARLARQAVEAVEHPALRAKCVHLSRFFPQYPRRITPEPDELAALERHAREFERLVSDACATA
ncbi:MAG TPA: hypothetical protein VFS00_26275, partial [Polyangiaceae bacterium]|nr:hypothetical protein [Polyangiaceae bacterium]